MHADALPKTGWPLTVAVVTKPFDFENRYRVAESGIEELSKHVDSLIVVLNDKLMEVYGEDAPGWAAREAPAYSRRVEVSGETAFCYVDDALPLLGHLEALPALRTLHRPANLEDVFLKLTGRELRD